MNADGACIHEELIQTHSLNLKELEGRADYKEKRIDELYAKIEKNINKERKPDK